SFRSAFRSGFGSRRKYTRHQWCKLVDFGGGPDEIAADSFGLSSRRDARGLRSDLRIHPYARSLWAADRPFSTRAGSLRRHFNLHGYGALGDLRGDLAYRFRYG